LVVHDGPISSVAIARELQLAPAGIRRHLGELQAQGLIEPHAIPTKGRGRGRPARYFVATASAHHELNSEAHAMAVQALDYLKAVAGQDALEGFASQRGKALEQRYQPVVDAAGPDLRARAATLAAALNQDGYAASLRPGPGGFTLQLCQGHCPVQQVAAVYPELCEAETQAIARLLGVHVQRLATLAGGEHVCTTTVPIGLAPKSKTLPVKEGEA
jgi:predicted ArsR family transcriptional regulator